MKKYKVEIIESYRHVIEVEAGTEDVAIRKTQKLFEKNTDDSKFPLSIENFSCADFNVLKEIR